MKKILWILSALFWFSLTPDRNHLAYVSSQATCISLIHFVLALYIWYLYIYFMIIADLILYLMIWVPAVLLITCTQLDSILTSCGCCEVIKAIIDLCCQSSRTGVIITKFISPVLSNSVVQSKQSQDFLQWLISIITPQAGGGDMTCQGVGF